MRFIYVDLRRLLKLCGISNREAIFLFIDTQIIDSIFLEDINSLIHTGHIPNLFRSEDIQEVRKPYSIIQRSHSFSI
jgi:dynein heavy chain, axonemal